MYPSTLKRLFVWNDSYLALPLDVDCYVHESVKICARKRPYKIFSENNIGEPIQIGDKLFYWYALPADQEEVKQALRENEKVRDALIVNLATLQKQEDVLRSYLI